MLRFLFDKKPDAAVQRLYDRAVAQARRPVFYQTFGVADTMDGRFEMVVFHVAPLVDRLRDDKGALLPQGQGLFDTFVNDMEGNLRTIGVGDLSVPKKMKKIGEAFYGRFDAYRRSMDDRADLALAVARNVYGDPAVAGSQAARGLAAYYAAMVDAAAGADPLEGFAFPDPAAFEPGAGEGAEARAEGAQ
jgi:cytochrome b pre-mRNA-processing protein 3